MAASDEKKGLPPKIAAMRARKRQKVEQPSAAVERPAKKAKTGNAKKPVQLDKLPWKDVQMPDRMDDYEGFFGLEEIDDVEVLRDELDDRFLPGDGVHSKASTLRAAAFTL